MGGEGRGRNHLDIATNSTDEISKNVQLRKSALHWASERAFSKLNIFGYFIVEFVAVSLGDGGGNVKQCQIINFIFGHFRNVPKSKFKFRNN